MKLSNVLVTCGGKWVGLVLHLKRAMSEVDEFKDGRIFVADRAEMTPAGYFADDAFTVPLVSDPSYVDVLLDICREHAIGMIVSHIDIDIERLTGHLDRFRDVGTHVVCPEPDMVAMCLDKVLFGTFAAEEGLSYPASHGPDELREDLFPLFAKRRLGFGSIGSGVCRTLADARVALEQYPDLIFQDVLTGPELSVDAFLSVTGKCTVRVQRVRDRIVGGEALQSHTVKWPHTRELADLTIAALARRGLSGPLNLQLFAGDDTHKPALIEVNSRIGSASVLSNIASGGRLVRSILQEASGGISTGDPDDYIEGLHLYRFYGDVYHLGPDPLLVLPDKEM